MQLYTDVNQKVLLVPVVGRAGACVPLLIVKVDRILRYDVCATRRRQKHHHHTQTQFGFCNQCRIGPANGRIEAYAVYKAGHSAAIIAGKHAAYVGRNSDARNGRGVKNSDRSGSASAS